jgi:hypothetical protein
MKLIHTPLLRKNKKFILENISQAKQYLNSGKLSTEEIKKMVPNVKGRIITTNYTT